MSSRYFTPLPEAKFKQLVDVAEANGGTRSLAGQQAAGSVLLEMYGGDESAAERALWGTWEYLVGGAPGNRPADAASAEGPEFLNRLVTVIVGDRNEQPPVVRLPRRAAA